MKKSLFSAVALSLLAATTVLAQTTPTTVTKDGGDKTISTADGMTVKTKMASDGKMKVKGKDDAGNSMKATTKPRKGDMKMMDGEGKKMHRKGMHKKGMMKDSTATGSSSSM
jgi:phosphate-selective porin